MKPSMVVLPGHGTGVSALTLPDWSTASAETAFIVEPGGKRPVSARAPWASAGSFCATARMSPVDGWMATRIAGCVTGSTASSAAAWTARDSAMVTALAGSGALECSSSTSVPCASTVLIRKPALPAMSFSTSLRTAGSTWVAKLRLGASNDVCELNRTPGSS